MWKMIPDSQQIPRRSLDMTKPFIFIQRSNVVRSNVTPSNLFHSFCVFYYSNHSQPSHNDGIQTKPLEPTNNRIPEFFSGHKSSFQIRFMTNLETFRTKRFHSEAACRWLRQLYSTAVKDINSDQDVAGLNSLGKWAFFCVLFFPMSSLLENLALLIGEWKLGSVQVPSSGY